MAWSTFFGLVMGAYAVYYVLNLLYDLFLSSKQKAPADAGVRYDMEELASDEEEAYDLSEEEADDYQNEDDELGEDYDEEEEQAYADEMEQEPAPALRVEGQGIPLDEFLRDAKSYSSSIF